MLIFGGGGCGGIVFGWTYSGDISQTSVHSRTERQTSKLIDHRVQLPPGEFYD